MQFEPFQDRLSRDIRNDLSATISSVLEQENIGAARQVADRYLGSDIAPCYRDYILDRLARYRSVLEKVRGGPDDVFWRALVLWDQGLFFEVHEVLEHAWKMATGPDKLILQAMIRAAGVYIKREHGYVEAARKMAERAFPVLEAHRDFLAAYFEPDLLLLSLRDLDQNAPKLLKEGL